MDTKTLCLGVLSQGAASGYEIKKRFERAYSHFYQAGFSSIYPALGRLMTDGLVACQTESQDKRPDKKVYRITAAGRLALVNELSKLPGDDRYRSEFLVVMMFCELLPPRLLHEVIERYLADQRERLEHVESCRAASGMDSGSQFVTGFGVAVHKAIVDYVTENRHLVEGAAFKRRLEKTA